MLHMNFDNVAKNDPEMMELINQEISRQGRHIELIASENFVSEQVMEAMEAN